MKKFDKVAHSIQHEDGFVLELLEAKRDAMRTSMGNRSGGDRYRRDQGGRAGIIELLIAHLCARWPYATCVLIRWLKNLLPLHGRAMAGLWSIALCMSRRAAAAGS